MVRSRSLRRSRVLVSPLVVPRAAMARYRRRTDQSVQQWHRGSIAGTRVLRDAPSRGGTLPGMGTHKGKPRLDGRALRRKFVRVLCVVLLLDLLVGMATFDDRTPTAGRFDASPVVEQDRARAARIQDDGESARFVKRGDLWVIAQVSSETVNVDGSGSRRTAGNRSGGLRVAFVGGSGAFGLGQGDEYTIASEISRLLNTGDAPVEVVNLGTPAWTIVDAARDLRERLLAGERFDVVVSYAGANEMYMGVLGLRVPDSMIEATLGVGGKPSDSLLEHWADRSVLARLAGREPRPMRTPLRIVDATTELGERMDRTLELLRTASPGEALGLGRLVRFNYTEGVRMLDELGAEEGFAVLHVLQPLKNDARGDNSSLRSLLVESAPGLLDLTDSLPQDCFYDQVHTTEACSKEVASAIVSEFRARDLGVRHR